MEEINYCTFIQIQEYLNTIGFNGMYRARSELKRTKPGKKFYQNEKLQKEIFYKEQYSKMPLPPINYIKRLLELTKGI